MTLPAHAKSVLHQISAWVYGGYAWFIFLLIVLPCSVLLMLLRRPIPGRRIAHIGARLLFRLGGMPVCVEGLDRLPQRPHILLVNHSSFLDPFILTALLPPSPGYAFTTRQEFPIQSVFCPIVKSLGTIVMPPPQQQHGRRNTGRLAAALRRGHSLIIFPEGAFRPEPGLQPFHSGAFVAAAKAGVPIVVAGVRGARLALPPRTWLPHRNAIVLKIGKVLPPDGGNGNASGTASNIAQRIAAARKEMLSLAGERN